jgi:hypothetical protein
MHPWLVPLLTIVVGINAHAEIYKSVDEQGNTTYSDQNLFETPSMQLPEIPVDTWQTPALPESTATASATSSVTPQYQLQWIAPQPEAVIRQNTTPLLIKVNLSPALDPQHALQLWVDGKAHDGVYSQLSFTGPTLARGAHQLQIKVVDAHLNPLPQAYSETITVHIQQPILRKDNPRRAPTQPNFQSP